MATAQDIVDEVRYVIHDENPTFRWSDVELLKYLNAGIRQIIQLVPEANVVEAAVEITNQLARQILPSGGIALIKVGHNYDDAGTGKQGVIRRVEKDVLDSYDPDWEYNSAATDGDNYFQHWCHDPKEPKVYFLYPMPPDASKYVGLVYSAVPTSISNVTDTYPLADEYFNATVMYMVFRALTKESRDTLPDDYRQDLWNNFLTSLGLEKSVRENAVPPQPPEGQ